ncbi:hypothetical protein J4417_00550 [Candidatus Woesearchaeota archaeon]|nr:hypothetical protein [Candidatus Woesearchaeota archaeon]
MKNKRGTLNISIEAIVIVVIAMTILGLALGFVKGLFGDIIDVSDTAFTKMSEDLTTNLATSDAPLLFSNTKLSIDRGDDSLQGFGVRNDGSSKLSYGVKFETFQCPEDAKEETGSCPDITPWFNYLNGDEQYNVKAAERQTSKVQITVPKTGVTPGLYLLKISAYTGSWPEGGECSGDESCNAFGQTELFLTIA